MLNLSLPQRRRRRNSYRSSPLHAWTTVLSKINHEGNEEREEAIRRVLNSRDRHPDRHPDRKLADRAALLMSHPPRPRVHVATVTRQVNRKTEVFRVSDANFFSCDPQEFGWVCPANAAARPRRARRQRVEAESKTNQARRSGDRRAWLEPFFISARCDGPWHARGHGPHCVFQTRVSRSGGR